ncbi:xanthine dehydrogenase family protein molybdopterin-binding subunit [Sphingomonas sp. HDW15A]|uniref:molybdopterin cofactor-binding domain-containing protein n=1 Tax=Sphingomonas sp. HDW15A TaxID=2714942 RepID=UPI00140BBF13|nr:molybdopterin cofactor-binding domain-containing protein [Sphingomonas sp. HDW15A]QIK96769.1 xanthine dehydrogenase family protein molybdopterin-binding subunit [Sphingomonas sp. HDW15A]
MIRFDRRSLLVAGGAGVGLIVAFSLWPREAESPLAVVNGERSFGAFLKIGRDGTVTVAIPQAEVGQGIWTGLAQIAADAIGAAWEQVAVEPAPSAPDYVNSYFATRVTAGSSSVRAFEAPIIAAAEAARGMLVRVAAKRWGVDPAQCNVGGGFVRHGVRAFAFAELAEDAAALLPAGPAGRLTTRLIGQSLPRLDLSAKSNGSIRFAGDVRLPGLVFAAARFAPPGGALTGYDRSAALARPGVREIVADSGWIAAIGETGWAARKALEAASPRFSGPATANRAAIEQALDEALNSGSPTTIVERGDFDAVAGNARPLGATYRIAPALHEGLEPLTATARFVSGRLDVWAPIQAYDHALVQAAKAGAVDPQSVVLYPTPVGDSAGQAVDTDMVALAVALAKRIGRPVQVNLAAFDTANRDRPRPPLLARMAAMPSASGSVGAWSAKFVSASGLENVVADKRKRPKLTLTGAAPPYAIPALRIEQVEAKLTIDCGYMRGGNEALTAFANESFVDELARNLNSEPFAFRMALLGGNPRLARTLVTATNRAGWDGGAPGSRMGLACASAFGSHIALVAVAGVGSDQRIVVDRLVAAVDCGRAINPALVRQQIEGGLLHALSVATARSPDFVAGMPIARGLRSAGIDGALKVPDILVEVVHGNADLGGVSGLGHTVLAPAVANALAASTGRRLRNLPFDLMAS